MKRKLLLSLIGGAALLVAGLGNAGPAGAAPAGAGICLTFSGHTSCTVTSDYGIKSVFVSLDTPDGVVVVVNEVYNCESPVHFEFDYVGPVHHWEIEECPPPDGVAPRPDLPLKSPSGPARVAGGSDSTSLQMAR